MKKAILYLTTIVCFSSTICNSQINSKIETKTVLANLNQTTNKMNSYISIFEIPATDITRAINFYEKILDIHIEKVDMPGMEMGIFPYEQQMVTGVIMKAEGYKPSANGVTIYLNTENTLEDVLDKVVENGGKIMVSKTPHADENGFFALFLDIEGNKIGLNSSN